MSSTTTYTCDRCGESKVGDRDFLKLVGVGFRQFGGSKLEPFKTAEWCPECIKHFRLVREEPATPEAPPALTIEDLIIEIVDQAVQEAMP